MTGGLIQLVAYGAQDMYLTANPQITFFKIVYRRHTNFSMETFEHNIREPLFGKKSSVIIPRNGDLITRMHLRITLTKIDLNPGVQFAWIRRLGHAIIRTIDIEIGGSIIDRHFGTWLDIWYELARRGDHERGYDKLIGDVPVLTEYNDKNKPEYVLFIPLQFWFNRHIGCALPMVAIQYHEVRIIVEFNGVENLIIVNDGVEFDDIAVLNEEEPPFTIKDANLLVDYIYLESKERRKFAVNGHEYLIELVQFDGENTITRPKERFRTEFNYPTKEIIWTMKNGNYTSSKKFYFYTHLDDWEQFLEPLTIELFNDIIHYQRESGGIPLPPDNFTDQIALNANNTNTQITANGKIVFTVLPRLFFGSNNFIYVNTNALIADGFNISDKIALHITVQLVGFEQFTLTIDSIDETLTVRCLSIPFDEVTDTRYTKTRELVCVNQFNNYGVLIDGTENPIEYTQIHFNDYDRVKQREGFFYNYVQSYMHHSNSAPDGVNLYSFALFPEIHQPSGASNLSRIEEQCLIVWFKDSEVQEEEYEVDLFDLESRFFIFAFSYNVMRVLSGLVGLAYSN